MDQKSWLWRKKSSEKTIFAVDNRLPRTKEVLKNPIDSGVGPEKFAKTALNEKLASVLLDCPVKEDLAIKHHEEKTLTQDQLSQEKKSKEKTEALKQSDKQQSIEEEEEKKIQEAVTIAHRKLEEKYAEASKQLADLTAENANMARALLAKEKLIGDLRRSKSEAESEFGALMMTRLDSTEKENAFLRYEFNVVERELRIRNEEMEYYRRSSDALQKKVAGLEQECQRLQRDPARRRLTGPPPGRRKSNPSRDLVVREAGIERSNFALERLRVVEEENEALKKALGRKIPELRSSKPEFDKQIVRRNRMSSDFDGGSDDAISSSGSWATNNINNAVVSEFEYLRNGTRGDFPICKAADISLMDDFVEMEKLAIVSSTDKPFDWLHVVLRAMLEQKHVSRRSLDELLEDIQIALGFINSPVTPKGADPPPISGYLTWSSMSTDTSPKEKVERNIQCSRSGLSESICKIVKLIQDQKPTSATSGDYFIRVFQWRNSELSDVLQRFVWTCDDLASGGSNLERFAEEVASTLDWILNNYVTPKEGLSARDKIKKHFGWNKTETENEESGWAPIGLENSQPTLEEENRRLRDELKSVMSEKADIEARLNSAIEKSEDLLINIEESRLRIGRLQEELDSVKETKLAMDDQIVNEKMISVDLVTQLTVSKAKLSELVQKVLSLEVELEEKRNCCEELEAACLELQLQLESDVGKETPKNKADLEEKQSQYGREITSASAKLAECQETSVGLGKQIKAVANTREAAILESVSIKKDKSLKRPSSLRDQMMAEDGAKAKTLIAQRVKATASTQSEICWSPSCRSGTALAIVASKRKGGGGGFNLLRKLLLRRKRSNCQKPQVRKM